MKFSISKLKPPLKGWSMMISNKGMLEFRDLLENVTFDNTDDHPILQEFQRFLKNFQQDSEKILTKEIKDAAVSRMSVRYVEGIGTQAESFSKKLQVPKVQQSFLDSGDLSAEELAAFQAFEANYLEGKNN